MRHTLFCLLLFGVISSCSLFQYKHYDNLLVTPAVATKEEGPFSFGNWPKEAWWDAFGSEKLSFLMEKGLKENPSLQVAKQRIEAARQIALQKRSYLLPWLSLDFTETLAHISKTGLYRAFNPSLPLNANLLDLGLNMTYTFDFWSKYRNLFEAAMGEAYAKEAEEKGVELFITTAIAEGYFALAINIEKRDLYAKLFELRSLLCSLEDLLQISGLASNFPVYYAREEVEAAKKALLAIEDEIIISRHLISALVGEGPSYDVPCAPIKTAPKDLTIPKDIAIDLVAKRPDLTAAIWRMEALSHVVGARVADFFPNISIQGLLGFETITPAPFITAASGMASLNPAINLPIFTAGNIRAGINEKKAEFEAAVFQYNELLLAAAKEVANNLAIATTFYQQKESQKIIVDNALLRFELRDALVKAGLANLLDLYREEIDLVTKKLEDLDLLYGQYFSVIELIKSLGGGYQSHEN